MNKDFSEYKTKQETGFTPTEKNNIYITGGGLTEDIVDSIKRVDSLLPLDAVLLPYLVCYGSQINHKYEINGRFFPINLHGVNIAPSGSGKSYLSSQIVAPFRDIQTTYFQTWRDQKKVWKEGGKKGAEPVESKIIIGGGTLQGMMFDLMQQEEHNPTFGKKGILIYETEGKVFFGGLNKWNKGDDEPALMTKLLDGSPISYTQRGINYRINEPSVGVFCDIQTSVFHRLLSKRADDLDQGFFSRWLYCFSQRKRNIPVKSSSSGRGDYSVKQYPFESGILSNIRGIIADTLSNTPIRFTEKALSVYDDYRETIRQRGLNYVEGVNQIDDFLNGYLEHTPEKVLSVASIAHILNVAGAFQPGVNDSFLNSEKLYTVDYSEMMFAVEIVSHYTESLESFLSTYGGNLSAGDSVLEGVRKLCKKIFNVTSRGESCPYEIYKNISCLKYSKDKPFRDSVYQRALDEEYLEVFEADSAKYLRLTESGKMFVRRC